MVDDAQEVGEEGAPEGGDKAEGVTIVGLLCDNNDVGKRESGMLTRGRCTYIGKYSSSGARDGTPIHRFRFSPLCYYSYYYLLPEPAGLLTCSPKGTLAGSLT
jgi:hypothetical protein